MAEEPTVVSAMKYLFVNNDRINLAVEGIELFKDQYKQEVPRSNMFRQLA